MGIFGSTRQVVSGVCFGDSRGNQGALLRYISGEGAQQEVRLAGLLHDLAREIDPDVLKKKFKKENIELRPDEQNRSGIWHAFVGSIIAQEDFDINDPEILEAIRYHSAGNAGMGDVAKAVYLADILEPERSGWHEHEETFQNIQKLIETDLNAAVMAGLAHKIHLSLAYGTCILSRSIELWNSLVERSS